MKKLTLERVVPIISARVSWLIFNHRLRFPFFSEVGQQQKHPRQPLLTGIEEMVDQVLLNPHVPGEHIGQEHLEKAGSSWSDELWDGLGRSPTVSVERRTKRCLRNRLKLSQFLVFLYPERAKTPRF